MEITLHLVEDGKKITAHAVVTPLATLVEGKKILVIKANVGFTLDGKFVKPVTTDEAGLASVELGELKVGTRTVTATVLGVTPEISTQEEIEIEKKKKEPTGPFGQAMMAVFWIAVWVVGWFVGAGWLLTPTLLVITMAILFLIANHKDVEFKTILGNNDWVFYAIVSMTLMSMLAAYLNPLLPQNKLATILDTVRSFFGMESKTTLRDSLLWSMLNRLFFGKAFTLGWRYAAGVYLVACFPAWLVSFTDDMKTRWAKHKASGGGWASFIWKDLTVEFVGIPFIKKILGIGEKK